MRTSRKNRKR